MNACLPAGTGAARLMLFVGGPATHGPGKVVDTDLQEPIRSHKVLGHMPAGCANTAGFVLCSCLTDGHPTGQAWGTKGILAARPAG